MSKKLSKKKVYSDHDFKNGTLQERLFMAMLEPERFFLRSREEKYFRNMRKAFAIMSETLSYGDAEQLILEACPEVTERTVKKLMNDTQLVIGNSIEVNKAFERAAMREKLLKLAEDAEAAGNFEVARRCLKDVADLRGLYIQDETKFDPDDLELPQIIITDDPSALMDDIDDIDYEET